MLPAIPSQLPLCVLKIPYGIVMGFGSTSKGSQRRVTQVDRQSAPKSAISFSSRREVLPASRAHCAVEAAAAGYAKPLRVFAGLLRQAQAQRISASH